MFQYFFVHFLDADGNTDHNAVIRSFEEMAELCQGRTPRIMGKATIDDYLEYHEQPVDEYAARRAELEAAEAIIDPKMVRVTNSRGEYYDGVIIYRSGFSGDRIKLYVHRGTVESLRGTVEEGTIVELSLEGHEVTELVDD